MILTINPLFLQMIDREHTLYRLFEIIKFLSLYNYYP